jgi:methionyl aminopeptidase
MNQSDFSDAGLVKLHDELWLQRQRIAGKIASEAISLLTKQVKEKTTKSLVELNLMAEEYILSQEGCTPTFKGYKGFPAGVCISVNKQLVHGIPTDYVLKDGDLVSFDLGVTYQGAIADTASTMIYGTAKNAQEIELVKTCRDSLYQAIKTIQIGKQLGSIGFSIYKFVTSKSNFKVITPYGGHGLDYDMPHAAPFVCNKAKQTEGIRMQPGLAIAIEPLLAIGSDKTKVDKDGWTVLTESLSSHTEHSIFLHQDSVEIITWREEEKDDIAPRIYF